MIKSSSKNGIRVEKDIELVMKNTGNIPWYDYLVQYGILAAICISICFCLSTGLQIAVDTKVVTVMIGLLVGYFMALYSFQSVFKYSGIVTFFFYVMFGYINLERLRAGYALVFNAFIKLYNDYFNASAATVLVSDTSYENGEQYFLLFIMVIIVAVVCYTGMYGKTMFGYILATAPLVYLCFVVGFAPSLTPYLCYIIGTMALFTGTICEKYGLFSKANRVTVGQFVVHTLEKARVRAQMISFITLIVLFGIIYFWYSPQRYEKEFDAKQIRLDVQEKIKEVTSSDLLKGTIFNKLSEQMDIQGNSGMSNGRLGRVGAIKYDNSTALKVTTEHSNLNKTLYLKGYVGEMYTGDSWRQLAKEDQEKVDELNEKLAIGTNVEQLYQQMQANYWQGLYPYLPAESFSMQIDNVSADSTCDYVPYNSSVQYEVYNGKVQILDSADSSYTMYDVGDKDNNSSYYEKLFKYGKFASLMQLNIMNTRIIEESTGKGIGICASEMDDSQASSLFESSPSLPLSSVDGSVNDTQNETVNLLHKSGGDAKGMISQISAGESYARDENEYFNLVKDVYTKLPDKGLDQVKELVKDKQVSYEGTAVENGYETMDQVDTTAYARKLYDRYKEQLGIEANEICSDDFTYDELMNQDRMFEAISYVKDYLAKNTSYTLSPGTTPNNKDYVEYFLFEQKKGYCMHYASAATVMLRAMGVPARYVEGYVVTEDDFKKSKLLGESSCSYSENGNAQEKAEDLVQVSVKDTNAHAWVEVYLPGYGWMPIEMTAPYSDGSSIEIPPVNSNPKATLKPTRKPTAAPKATANAKATAAPSSTAAATKAPALSENSSWIQGIQKWYQGLSSAVKKTIQLSVTLVILLALAILVIWIRKRLLYRLFVKRMQKMTGNERLLYAYRELVRFTGKHIPEYETNVSYTEYAKKFTEVYPFVSESDATVYFNILLKAKFGMAEISREEEHLAMAFYRSFIRTMYEGMSRVQKLYYDYIFILRK